MLAAGRAWMAPAGAQLGVTNVVPPRPNCWW